MGLTLRKSLLYLLECGWLLLLAAPEFPYCNPSPSLRWILCTFSWMLMYMCFLLLNHITMIFVRKCLPDAGF